MLDVINELTVAGLAQPDTWIEDPQGLMDEGSIGGDIQAGPAWGRRFVRWMPTISKWALITDAFYRTEEENRDGTTTAGICNQTEFLVCTDPTDPGGTEGYSDYTYEDLDIADDSNDDSKRLAMNLQATDYGDPFKRSDVCYWACETQQSTWCNCQAIPGSINYPGPWHEKSGESHYPCYESGK